MTGLHGREEGEGARIVEANHHRLFFTVQLGVAHERHGERRRALLFLCRREEGSQGGEGTERLVELGERDGGGLRRRCRALHGRQARRAEWPGGAVRSERAGHRPAAALARVLAGVALDLAGCMVSSRVGVFPESEGRWRIVTIPFLAPCWRLVGLVYCAECILFAYDRADMLRIRTLEIDAHIEEKIEQAHGVAFLEADEVASSPAHYVRRGRNDLYLVFGQTDAGRYLLVVLADHGAGLWRVVTARDMTATERRVYREERGLR